MVKACEMTLNLKSMKAKISKKKQVSTKKLKTSSECHFIPLTILDELAARFMVNIPMEERDDLMRICFQLELSHWFYIDFYVPNNPGLPEGSIQEFAAHMFNHVPFLHKYMEDIDVILERWNIYKKSVPVNGVIMLNKQMDKILLVKGCNPNSTWNFPKGKVNQDEEYHVCAAREVYEETGFDSSDLINRDLFLERVINDQTVRLYLVSGVDEDYPFKPRSRGEISQICWWDVTELPTSLGDKEGTRQRLGTSVHMFYNSIPFIKDIQQWVADLCFQDARQRKMESLVTEEKQLGITSMNHHSLENVFFPQSWKNFKFNLHELEDCVK